MAESVAAPVAPAAPAAAPQAPAQSAAAPEAPKPHHSAQQPRTSVGTFDRKPEAPAFVEIDGKRIPMEQARAIFAERMEDERVSRAEQEELQRLRQQAQRWQRPHEALTPEQRREIARLELLEFQRQQEEARLPPEQQALLRERRALERERQEWERKQQEAQEQQRGAEQAAQRAQAVSNVQSALNLLGATEADGFVLRMVVDEFWSASERGKNYPPEVVAQRVQRQLDGLTSQRAAKLGPKALLSNPDFVAALNSLDDADLLKALAPLGERLRTLNLQSRGLTPPAQQTATPTNVVPLKSGQQPRTDAEWIQHFRTSGAPDPSNSAAHAKYWALRDRGVL